MFKKFCLVSVLSVLMVGAVSVVEARRGRGGGGGGGGGGGASQLSAAEKEGLLEMREEEKLARDVYLTLGEKWKVPIFGNIADSEQRHTDAIKGLLDKYGLADPAAGNGIGEFTDPKFATLYEQLVAQGMQSLEEALKVGVAIEELDIADIKSLLIDVEHDDIRRVYENLLAGSYNHLRAFQSLLGAE